MNKSLLTIAGYSTAYCLGVGSVLFYFSQKPSSDSNQTPKADISFRSDDYFKLEQELAKAKQEIANLQEDIDEALEISYEIPGSEPPAELSDEAQGDELLKSLDVLLEGGLQEKATRQMEVELGILKRFVGLDDDQAEQLRDFARSFWDHRGIPVPLHLNRFDSPLKENIASLLDSDQRALYSQLMEKNQADWVESRSLAELAELQLERNYTETEKDALYSELVDKYATESQRR